ncbi:hypothetical protein MMC07_003315 [Pseudocyphellaria aurata]|nr:hypothetical protein [Pseudocyphellaria aurata]
MYFFAATRCLVSVVVTLAVVTTSLPQSPSGPSEDIFIRTNPDNPFGYHPPKGCVKIGATNFHLNILGNLGNRDLQPPESHAGALEPRRRGNRPPLPCGTVAAGGQSDPFGFPDSEAFRMFWNWSEYTVTVLLVRIMLVVPNGQDLPVATAMARRFAFARFTPAAGEQYYIKVSGIDSLNCTWYFDYLYAFPPTLCSGALANQAEQSLVTDAHDVSDERVRWETSGSRDIRALLSLT